jgi:hypothetical protein
MAFVQFLWDEPEDEGGNYQHICVENDVSPDEYAEVYLDPRSVRARSRSSGRPMAFGSTSSGRHLVVVWEDVSDDPPAIRPVTAYDTPPPRAKGKGRRTR